jgi:hypothetical protein
LGFCHRNRKRAGTDSLVNAERNYTADIVAGSLKMTQTRVIAGLLLDGVSGDSWKDAIEKHNVIQMRSTASAQRLASLIRRRLDTMNSELWRLIKDGPQQVATHAVLAATIKQSALVGDFLDLVVREQYRLFRPALDKRLWNSFIDGCRERDPAMPRWYDSTINRLRSSVFQILAQGGYIENTRSLMLRRNRIAPEVIDYLTKNQEAYVLRCIQVGK